LKRFRFFFDPLIGSAIFVLIVAVNWVFWMVLYSAGPRVYASLLATYSVRGVFAAPAGVVGVSVFVIAAICNGFAEELVMRGYFIPRLERLLQSTPVAVIGSTSVFVLYHAYQGAAGMIGVAITGFVYALLFVKMRRIWPLAVAHAIQDLWGLTALWTSH